MSEPFTRYRRDSRKAAIQRAVDVIAEAIFARDIHISEIVAALSAKSDTQEAALTPRESAVAVQQSRRERMVAEFRRLEQEGRGRSATRLVARKFARDPLDMVEVANLVRNLYRWCPRKKDNVNLPPIKSVRD